jgi:hypothetical protein
VTLPEGLDTVVKPVPLPLAKTVKLTTSPVVRPVKVTLCVPAATAAAPVAVEPTVLVASRAAEVVSIRFTVYSEATPSASHVTVAAPAPPSVATGAPVAEAPSTALNVIAFDASDTVEEVLLPLGVTV